MVYQTDNTQQERKEEVRVSCTVLLHLTWQHSLRTEVQLVDCLDSRKPIAISNSDIRSLYIVLATYEVPKEISPIHIVELIGQEVVQVFAKGRLDDRVVLHAIVVHHLTTIVCNLLTQRTTGLVTADITLLITHEVNLGTICCPRLIVVLLLHIVPHTWEEVHKLLRIYIVINRSQLLVALCRSVVVIKTLLRVALDRCGIRSTIEERSVAVLVTIQHRKQCARIVWIVRVHRRIHRCTDSYRGVR